MTGSGPGGCRATAPGHNEQLRQYGYADLVNILAGKHPLRPGLTPLRARDVLLVLTTPQLFVQFTRELGWSSGELAAWVTTAVLERVFGTTRDPAAETSPRAP
jgi:hypothetical protein